MTFFPHTNLKVDKHYEEPLGYDLFFSPHTNSRVDKYYEELLEML
jgi:hypothetical protein